jgi:hypothetical protein
VVTADTYTSVSSIVVTADTYTSVPPEVQRRCADATAQLVLKVARRNGKKIKNKARKNRPDRRPKTGAPAPAPVTPGTASTTRVRKSRRGEDPPRAATPTLDLLDTHRPHRPDGREGLMRVFAAQTRGRCRRRPAAGHAAGWSARCSPG